MAAPGLGVDRRKRGTKDVRDRVLAHVDRASVDSRYAQAALDQPAREWWAKWADFLTGLTASETSWPASVSGTIVSNDQPP
jgi:hypothetical protein